MAIPPRAITNIRNANAAEIICGIIDKITPACRMSQEDFALRLEILMPKITNKKSQNSNNVKYQIFDGGLSGAALRSFEPVCFLEPGEASGRK